MKLLTTLCIFVGLAAAHDLEENRATLVLRDRTHLSLTLYLNYTEALHKALLPQREYGAFLLIYSAMKLEDLQKELVRAQSRFQSELQLHSKGSGEKLRLTGWTWPDEKTVQSLLQHQVMQAMVDGHVHETPVEIRAETVATGEITSVALRLPTEFPKVLVVSYRPNQVWVDPASPSPEIKF
jgi:hypothetical protein